MRIRTAYQRSWESANREKRNAQKRAWRILTGKQYPEQKRAWAAVVEDPELARARHARRKARLRGAAGSHTAQEWTEKVELHAGCCFYCGERRPLTRDHKTPIARGGTDDISNILPACRPCNSRKGIRTASEFIKAA